MRLFFLIFNELSYWASYIVVLVAGLIILGLIKLMSANIRAICRIFSKAIYFLALPFSIEAAPLPKKIARKVI